MAPTPKWLSTTLASDASSGQGVLPEAIRPLDAGQLAIGPAYVVASSVDDNLAIGTAIAAKPPKGSVLVVAGHRESRRATVGGLLALELKTIGVAGLVTEGVIRDAKEIRDLRLQVWSRGVTPIAPRKADAGTVGGSARIGDVVINTGDLVIADDDGVVIWPAAEVPSLLERAKGKMDADNEKARRIRASARPKAR
jgi:regulator of RNase E activity RraA